MNAILGELLAALPEPHLVVDLDGVLVAANRPARAELLGGRSGVGWSLADRLQVDRSQFSEFLRSSARCTSPVIGTLQPVDAPWQRSCEGLRLQFEGRTLVLLRTPRIHDAARKLLQLGVELAEQRESTRSANRRAAVLAQVADTDPLTGIPARRPFDRELRTRYAEARRRGEPISLLMIDVDRFKLVNDTLGHRRGDELLVAIARTLEEGLRRPADMVARFGGEEFACVLPDTDPSGAVHLAETLRAAVEALRLEHPDGDGTSVVTVSIGAATSVPSRLTRCEALIDDADQALYAAKAQGRNRVRHAQPTDAAVRPPLAAVEIPRRPGRMDDSPGIVSLDANGTR